MKLKTKLIPLTALATAAAVATPLAVSSCAKQDKTYDITHGFIPGFNQYSENVILSQYQATAEYVKFAKENPELFIQDLAYGAFYNWQEIFGRFSSTQKLGTQITMSVDLIDFTATTPTFGTSRVQFSGETPLDYPTVSFTSKQTVAFKMKLIPQVSPHALVTDIVNETEYEFKLDITTEYKDVIFFACPFNPAYKMDGAPEEMYDPTGRTWYISFLDGSSVPEAMMGNSNPWSISASANSYSHQTTKDPRTGQVRTETANESTVSVVLDSIMKLVEMYRLVDNFMGIVQDLAKGDSEMISEWLRYYDGGMMMWGSMLNFKSYYLDATYHSPVIENITKGGMLGSETYAPLSNNELIVPEDEPTTCEFDLGRGLQFVPSRYVNADKKVDIGNVKLILDEPIRLSQSYINSQQILDAAPVRVVQIGDDSTNEYDIIDWTGWEEEDPIIINIPAKLVVKDDSGEYVDAPFTAEEVSKYGIDDGEGYYYFDFKLNKKQLNIQIPVYEQTAEGDWNLISTIDSIIDLRTPTVRLWYHIEY